MKRLRYVNKISIMYKIKYRLKSVKIGVQNSYRYLAMCNELEGIAFCIWHKTSSFIFCSTSFEQRPRTSMMMLYCLPFYSGYRIISSSLS